MAVHTFSIALILCISLVYADELSVCHMKSCQPAKLPVSSLVSTMCHSATGKTKVEGRCCLRSMNHSTSVTTSQEKVAINNDQDHQSIIAIDLSGCELSDLKNSLVNISSLELLLLQNNSHLNFTTDEFIGLTSLNYSTAPSSVGCPGGKWAWSVHKDVKDHVVCEGQIDVCKVYKVNCPTEEAHCVTNGPGVPWCECNKYWYGYKCLRSGNFPYYVFFGAMGGSTFALATGLWLLLRMNAGRNPANDGYSPISADDDE